MLERLGGILGAGHRGKFQRDVTWNMASFAVMAVCGILFNVLVGLCYGASTLGVFNQVFAVYIFFSQFAALGIHYSALKHSAERAKDRSAFSSVLVGALIPTCFLAAVSCTAYLLVRPLVGQVLESPGVTTGMAWSSAGLFFFAINKVLLGGINGLRWMKAFAVLQASRPVVMVATFLAAYSLELPGNVLPVAFSAAEIVVFVGAIGLIARRGYLHRRAGRVGNWIRTHLSFGVRSFASGAMVELNTRVDVLMLGYFGEDELVGVYSFAAILAEGIYQLLVVLRNNYNPRLVQYLKHGDLDRLSQIIRRGKRSTYLMMFMVGVVAIALFPAGVWIVGGQAAYMSGWPLFATLVIGLVVASGYIPFNHILVAAGRPGTHTLLILLTVLCNVIGNAVLIPLLSAQGAALATAFSHVCHVVLLFALTRIAIKLYL